MEKTTTNPTAFFTPDEAEVMRVFNIYGDGMAREEIQRIADQEVATLYGNLPTDKEGIAYRRKVVKATAEKFSSALNKKLHSAAGLIIKKGKVA